MLGNHLRVGYVAVQLSTYFADEEDQVGRALRGLTAIGERQGFDLVPALAPVESAEQAEAARHFLALRSLDALIVHAAACSLADTLLALVALDVPLVLWAGPEPTFEGDVRLNSYVTLQIFASTLRTRFGGGRGSGRPYKWMFGEVEDPAFEDRLQVTIRALRAVRALRARPISMVGALAPGFDNLSFDEGDLAHRFGLNVTHAAVPDLVLAAEAQPPSVVAEVQRAMAAAARSIEVPEESLTRSARTYLTLRDLANRTGCSSLAVRDWPEFQSMYQLSPLLAMAWLSEAEGYPVACEGDLLGAAGLTVLKAVADHLPTLVDFGPPDLPGDAALLWHLGSSPHRLANHEGVRYRVHSTLGRRGNGGPWGAVVDQVFAPGPVTLVNLSHEAHDLFVMEAEIFDRPSRGLSGDRGWSRAFSVGGTEVALPELLNTLLVRGLAHHCGMVQGRWTDELSEFGQWLGLRLVAPIRPSRALQVDWADGDSGQ